jgi:hypothetical protein
MRAGPATGPPAARLRAVALDLVSRNHAIPRERPEERRATGPFCARRGLRACRACDSGAHDRRRSSKPSGGSDLGPFPRGCRGPSLRDGYVAPAPGRRPSIPLKRPGRRRSLGTRGSGAPGTEVAQWCPRTTTIDPGVARTTRPLRWGDQRAMVRARRDAAHREQSGRRPRTSRSDAGAENRGHRRSRSRVTSRATMIHRPRPGTRPAGLIASSSPRSPRSRWAGRSSVWGSL